MNFLLIALVSAVLVISTINTEPKDSEGNKKTQVIVKESSETKPDQEEVKEEVKPEAQVAAEAQAAEDENKDLKTEEESNEDEKK